jgi:putative hydrolase
MADEPAEPPDPFRGVPFFGDLAKMLGGTGGVPWDAARQMAIGVATGGQTEPNVDPAERQRYAEMSRIAELHIARTTGLTVSRSASSPVVVPVTRAEWAAQTLSDYRPFLEALSDLNKPPEQEPDQPADPIAQLFGGLFQMLGPAMTAMTAGSMVGQLAQRSLGSYDLPLPRPGRDRVLVVAPTLAEFAAEWEVPGDDLRLWICLHELTLHTVLGVGHVGAAVSGLVTEYLEAFQAGDGSALEDRLGSLELDPTAGPEELQRRLQDMFGDPEVLLGAIRSPAQDLIQPRLQALVDVLVGYVDHVLDGTGRGLIGSFGQLTEALRRRRVTAGAADRFVEKLLGLEVTRASVERGQAFVQGVVERADADGLRRLWTDSDALPTPNEVDAPGLWLARIDLES